MRCAILAVLLATAVSAADPGRLQQSFQNPPPEARIMMRWWWFGPAVTKTQLEREMRLMKLGGIGGFEVQPTYPLALDDSSTGFRNLPFLSDDFLEALRFTAEKARELGLRMDLTLGSGWPFGGPTVSVDHAAGRLRIVRTRTVPLERRVPVPSMENGEDLIGAFAAPLVGGSADGTSMLPASDIREGALYLPPDMALPAEVLFFISSRTGMQVKRPSAGAEGFVLNHYDRIALDHYLRSVGDRLMSAFSQERPYAVFCDSLEVYQSDWTGDFLEEFSKRRGYDLRPHLPALAMDAGPQTPEIRRDWGKTLTELYEERFAAPLQEWARKNGVKIRIQGYGTPPAALSSYAFADLPEGEGHQWRGFSTSRWAASAGHLLGHPVISSETWTWLHSPSFRATPLDVKAEADRHFLQGINQLIGHGWPYTAEGAEYPGWRFYAAGVFNHNNPWWIVMPDLSLYLQRASWMLRQGTPIQDVLLYLPVDDAYAQFQNGQTELNRVLARLAGEDVIPQILDAGFDFGFVDDGILERRARLTRGALVFDSARRRAVVLPGVERIPAATLRTLHNFAQLGGTVIATRRLPSRAPGFTATEADHEEIRGLVRRLFQGADAPGVFVPSENGLGRALAQRVRPDVVFSPAVQDLGFVHRSTPEAEIYFLANTGNEGRSVKGVFRVELSSPEWWDPMTGAVSAAEASPGEAGTVSVRVDLPAYGSRFLVFTKRRLPQASAADRNPSLPAALDLSQGWRVRFGENSPEVDMENLRSWTDSESTRYFSGVATYEREFNITEALLRPGLRLWLDLGESKPVAAPSGAARMQALLEAPVREAAVVYIDGERMGSAWSPPYRVELTGRMRPGAHRIRIDVANLAINSMAARALPDYRLLNLRYGVRFEPQDMKNLQPVPSGLLGPVRIVAAER